MKKLSILSVCTLFLAAIYTQIYAQQVNNPGSGSGSTLVSPPAVGTWTAVVASGSSNSTFGPLYMQPAASGYGLLARAQPATPYTIDIAVDSVLTNAAGNSLVSVGWRESATNKTTHIELEGSGSTPLLACINRTANGGAFSSFGCGTSGTLVTMGAGRTYFRLVNTGAILRTFVSPDNLNWQQFGTDVNVNTYFTTAPDQVFLECNSNSASNLAMSCSFASYYAH